MIPSNIESGICTPIGNYFNNKNIENKKLNDLVSSKLNNLNKNQKSNYGNYYNSGNKFKVGEISNFSLKNICENNDEKTIKMPFNPDISNGSFNNENITNNEQKINNNNNINPFLNNNNNNNFNNENLGNENNYIVSTQNKIINTSNKMIRVIKGGGGKNDENKNHFFSKMLSSELQKDNNLINKASVRNSLKNREIKKKNIDKLQREKFEQELKMLDGDDFNNSKDTDLNSSNVDDIRKKKFFKDENNQMSYRNRTPDKNIKNSIWNIFS